MSKDPRYPLGVPKDRRHNSTVRAHEAFLVGQGMAAAIWDFAYGEGGEVPSAAYEAAGALLEIYARVNDLDVERLIDRLGDLDPRNDDDFIVIGAEMAARALGRPKRVERFSLEGTLRVPQFMARMDGSDLVWEGDDAPRARQNPPWRPIGVEAGGRYQTYYRDGRKSWAFEDSVLADDWAKEIKGRVEERGPGGYTHYGRQNPSKTATQMLASLRQQRDVSIASNRDGYQLLVAGRDNDNRNNRIYIGTDLDELIRRAYNGEPGDINANPVGDRVDVMQGPGRGRSGVVESETTHVARVRFDRGGGAGHLERSALRTRGRSRD